MAFEYSSRSADPVSKDVRSYEETTLSNSNISPVGRFSPAPGLFLDRTGNNVAISGSMELFGPEANAARAHLIEHHINNTWTVKFPDGYSVSCKIKVTYRSAGSPAGNVVQIEAVKTKGPSYVNTITKSMTLNASKVEAFTWTATHEFGHILGLQDRYSEGIMSKITGMFGGTRSTTVDDPLYQANLMAISGGVLESRNVGDLALENQPSPYWVSDDDQVRDWVNHHNLAEIGLLSSANKIAMIKTLMGGWISEADVAAMIRICSSVTSKKEANAIRNSINTLDFTNIGQRTRVRVAFTSMPS